MTPALRDLIRNVPVEPGSDTDRLLRFLADGRERTGTEIRAACGDMTVHSRCAAIRDKLPAFGLELPLARRVDSSEGALYFYRLRLLSEEGHSGVQGLSDGAPTPPSSLSGTRDPLAVAPGPSEGRAADNGSVLLPGVCEPSRAAQLALDLRQVAA